MTTDPTPLQERIERILAEHPIQPPTYAGDDPIAVKRKRTAARVVEEVHAEVRKAQAEALRDAADSVHDNMATPYCRPCHREDADLLRTIADQIEAGDQA